MNLKPIIEHCEYLVSKDETELALKQLELVPGYYRDHYPQELQKLKESILSAMTVPHDLLSDHREMPKTVDHSVSFMNGTARGMALKMAVKEANEKTIKPNILDLGPGDFTFAIGMAAEDLRFNYHPRTLNRVALEALDGTYINVDHSWTSGDKLSSPNWFVAYEVIEHLDPREIQTVFFREGPFSKIFLSTPKYTFGNGTENWKTEGIHHLRTYTPNEFILKAQEMFKGYKWSFVDNEVMVLIGDKNA